MDMENSSLSCWIETWEASSIIRMVYNYQDYEKAIREHIRRFPQKEAEDLVKLNYYKNFPNDTCVEFNNWFTKVNKYKD